MHEPSPPTRLIIFIVTGAVRSCPQTLHFYLERLNTPLSLLLIVQKTRNKTNFCNNLLHSVFCSAQLSRVDE